MSVLKTNEYAYHRNVEMSHADICNTLGPFC